MLNLNNLPCKFKGRVADTGPKFELILLAKNNRISQRAACVFEIFEWSSNSKHDMGVLAGSSLCLMTTGHSLAKAKLAKKARFQWGPIRVGPAGLSKRTKKF